jgi:ribosomal protein S12
MKLFGKKNYGDWKSTSARFEKQGLMHKVKTDALEQAPKAEGVNENMRK